MMHPGRAVRLDTHSEHPQRLRLAVGVFRPWYCPVRRGLVVGWSGRNRSALFRGIPCRQPNRMRGCASLDLTGPNGNHRGATISGAARTLEYCADCAPCGGMAHRAEYLTWFGRRVRPSVSGFLLALCPVPTSVRRERHETCSRPVDWRRLLLYPASALLTPGVGCARDAPPTTDGLAEGCTVAPPCVGRGLSAHHSPGNQHQHRFGPDVYFPTIRDCVLPPRDSRPRFCAWRWGRGSLHRGGERTRRL